MRTRFTLKIDTSNDDSSGYTVALGLRAIAHRVEGEHPTHKAGPVRDIFGNTIGTWTLTIEED